MEIDHELFSMDILCRLLNQEGPLPVSSERIYTHLEYWLMAKRTKNWAKLFKALLA